MKGIEEQTYYEILEVGPTASAKEIQRAYEHAKETFHADSLAVYSLFTEQEVNEIQVAVEEAYRVLIDEALRKSYDQSHHQRPGGPQWEMPPTLQALLREKKALPAPTGASVDTGEVAYRGKTLKQVRERVGMDLEIISRETRIGVKALEAIEDEDLGKLPARVYLKGFLKGYARSLGLDPQKVAEGYLQFVEESREK